MKLLVVITSYRAKELTIDCLRSLEKEVESGNKSVESVQDYYISLRSNVVKPEDLIAENVWGDNFNRNLILS